MNHTGDLDIWFVYMCVWLVWILACYVVGFYQDDTHDNGDQS